MALLDRFWPGRISALPLGPTLFVLGVSVLSGIFVALALPTDRTAGAGPLAYATAALIDDLLATSAIALEEVNRRLVDVSAREIQTDPDLHQYIERFDRYLPPNTTVVVADAHGTVQWSNRASVPLATHRAILPKEAGESSGAYGYTLATVGNGTASNAAYLVVTRPRMRFATLDGWLSIYLPLASVQSYANILSADTLYRLFLIANERQAPLLLDRPEPATTGRALSNDKVTYDTDQPFLRTRIGVHNAFIHAQALPRAWWLILLRFMIGASLLPALLALTAGAEHLRRQLRHAAATTAPAMPHPASIARPSNALRGPIDAALRVFCLLQGEYHRRLEAMALVPHPGQDHSDTSRPDLAQHVADLAVLTPLLPDIDHLPAGPLDLRGFLVSLIPRLCEMYQRDVRAAPFDELPGALPVAADPTILTLILADIVQTLLSRGPSVDILLTPAWPPAPMADEYATINRTALAITCTNRSPAPGAHHAAAVSFDLALRLLRLSDGLLSSSTDPRGGLTYFILLPTSPQI